MEKINQIDRNFNKFSTTGVTVVRYSSASWKKKSRRRRHQQDTHTHIHVCIHFVERPVVINWLKKKEEIFFFLKSI